ncbi:hypothetical protein KIN20_003237 [Parelaphostrongylus tenuis]|uniref:Uncharacterized protein n=1 Tax=Parelaphostrongylus tenuis TaxID=148309 RepID=A0AAD5QHA3_PARTN|nr:hypothetical protein KIN20_003237 [Parelaphostrongylus tenuis]
MEGCGTLAIDEAGDTAETYVWDEANVLNILTLNSRKTGTRSFTATDFTVPVPMAYSTKGSVPARVPGIATTQVGAKRFVTRLVMQPVSDVLERQARSALLPDAVIAAILGQLNVTCLEVDKNEQKCIIVGNTVTEVCVNIAAADGMKDCVPTPNMTTDVIMANWPKVMWESELNRAVRMLTLGPLGSHFFSEHGTVGGD